MAKTKLSYMGLYGANTRHVFKMASGSFMDACIIFFSTIISALALTSIVYLLSM